MKKLLLSSLMMLSVAAFAQDKHCKGTKKDGTACKSTIINKAGYCRVHDPNAVKCAGKNSKGQPCGMIPPKGEKYCRHHKRG